MNLSLFDLLPEYQAREYRLIESGLFDYKLKEQQDER